MKTFEGDKSEHSSMIANFVGASAKSIISKGNELTVTFTSDLYINKKGFSASFKSHNLADKRLPSSGNDKVRILCAIDFHQLLNIECGGAISQEHGQVMSPNFPNPYLNNADCIWTITSGSGTPMYLKLLVFKVWKFYFILLCTQ